MRMWMNRAKSAAIQLACLPFTYLYMVNYVHSNTMISLYGNYSKIIRT